MGNVYFFKYIDNLNVVRTALIASISLIVLVLILILLSRPDPLPTPKAAGSTIRIATANILFSNSSTLEASAVLAGLDLDLLVVLEWSGENLDTEILAGASLMPVLDEPARGTQGIAVFAKPGISVAASLYNSPIRGPCSMPGVTLAIQFGPRNFNFIGVHAPPPISVCGDKTDATVLDYAKAVSEGVLVSPMNDLLIGVPTLIGGDFNSFPWSKSFDGYVESGLTDSYSSARSKFGSTWSPLTFLPAVARIDYIFVPSEIDVSGAWTIDIPGSDHRAIVVDVAL